MVQPPTEQTLKRYNITLEDWWTLWRFQAERCACCGKPPSRAGRMHLDHDHKTGQLRGIVHPLCNGKLGKVHDSIEWLQNAASYLTDPPGPAILGETARGRTGPTRRKRRRT